MRYEHNDHLESLTNLFGRAHRFSDKDRKPKVGKQTLLDPSTAIEEIEGRYTSNNGIFIMRGKHAGIDFIHSINKNKLENRIRQHSFIMPPEDARNEMICDEPLTEALLELSFSR